MKPPDPGILEILNATLTAELTAINQYFLHAEMCRNWGYDRLYDIARRHSIEEMRHAEKLIERVLYLEGIPNVQRIGKVKIGETVPEQLRLDLDLERDAVIHLNKSIQTCLNARDSGSADLLESILRSEEEHIQWLEAQMELIRQAGEQNYLAQQIVKKEED